MTPLAGLLPAELSERLDLTPAYRGHQLFEWLHRRLVFSFPDMSNLPVAARQALEDKARALTLEPSRAVRAPDGTVKFRFRLSDGPAIESVLLQDREGRHTACLSTQAGCAMGCRFCRTGQLGLARNLRDHEIVEQFLLLSQHLRRGTPEARFDGRPEGRFGGLPAGLGAHLDSVVFMGMGEPLANLGALRQAVAVLTHRAGAGLSLRRLTISTCGLVEGILELAEAGPHTRLAVSLASADARVREQLMPIASANPLPELRRALLIFQEATGKRLSLEIVLMQGINDRMEDVGALLGFLGGSVGRPLRALVNLIPWNEVPGMGYRRPSAARVQWFERQLLQAGVPVAVRASRGGAVAGACGQLG